MPPEGRFIVMGRLGNDRLPRRLKETLCIIGIFTLAPPIGAATSDRVHYVFEFSKSKLIYDKISGFDLVRYEGLELSSAVAAPQLPIRIVHVPLPSGKRFGRVELTGVVKEELKGAYDLFPVQPPRALSDPNVSFVRPSQGIYSSADPFPDEIIRLEAGGYCAGAGVGEMVVFPLQYVPSRKKIVFYSRIECEVYYEDSEGPSFFLDRETYGSGEFSQRLVESLVSVPPLSSRPIREIQPGAPIVVEAAHPYVIITSDRMVNSFRPLADWKTKKGLSARIVTTQSIYSSFPGKDAQEQIRNFIKDAVRGWGTQWVLLGGDVDVIPERTAYAMDCELGSPLNNRIPCDLYYSDLDGDWNANGNDVYGEVGDDVDMYPDVVVGRASVENETEAENFVTKVLAYEKSPPKGHETNMLFLAEILWRQPYTNSGFAKDHIDSVYVSGRFDPVAKLYEALGNQNYWTVKNALNFGQNIINHNGHAWISVLSIGNGYLLASDVDELSNGPRYSILYSIGCWPAAFDYDCIGENFITNPKGGGVAFIGNSRYGWGSPGNPLYGYSDRFDQRFFKALFHDNFNRVGEALAASKAAYVPLARRENVYRWCEYEINLLGDPEMPIWTDSPRPLIVSHPPELPVGRTICPVTVTDGKNPVEGALVCAMQGSAVYSRGVTGPGGRAVLEIYTANSNERLHLTVTARNFIPHELSIALGGDQPFVGVASYSTNGSKKALVRPGEVVFMGIVVRNAGNCVAEDVRASLCGEPGVISMVDGTESLGRIMPGDSVTAERAFSFRTSSDFDNGRTVVLECVMSDSRGHTWTDRLGVTGAKPVISYYTHRIRDDRYGDGDGFAEPGERVGLTLVVRNSGLEEAARVTARLHTAGPVLQGIDQVLNFGNIPPSRHAQAHVELLVESRCPDPSFPRIGVALEMEGGYRYSDEFNMAIGRVGIHDNMEEGEGFWQRPGADNKWCLTSKRSHSGLYSWYCGDEETQKYNADMQDTLETMPIVIERNAQLSFWCWYEFPNYGTDGVYIETSDGSRWTTLDFLGSGGALGHLSAGNDWLRYTYDLSAYPAGTAVTLRFRFVSDGGGTAEGVYIDDVSIQRREPEDLIIEPPNGYSIPGYSVQQNYPNPFNGGTTIKFSVPVRQSARIDIFDVRGAFVRRVLDGEAPAGTNEAFWDGRDARGEQMSSGIYFYRVTAGGFEETKKMVLLK